MTQPAFQLDEVTERPRRLAYHVEEACVHRAAPGLVFELSVPRFKIEAGQVVAVVGSSGCGKSTLLDMLGLVRTPDHAKQFACAATPSDAATRPTNQMTEPQLAGLRRSCMGYVMQRGGLLPFLTIQQNIQLVRRLNGKSPNAPHVNAYIQSLGIADQLKKKPSELSGGQRQRAAIARALAHDPMIILADEPTGAVDQMTARAVFKLLVNLAREAGATVIVVTHDLNLIAHQTDRVFSFDVEQAGDGRICSTLWEGRWRDGDVVLDDDPDRERALPRATSPAQSALPLFDDQANDPMPIPQPSNSQADALAPADESNSHAESPAQHHQPAPASQSSAQHALLILWLALKDLMHERALAACMVLALAAVIAPLLILYGLKNGTVQTLRDRLVNDPRNLEVHPATSNRLDQAWFTTMAARPDVGFVIPATRYLATAASARVNGQGRLHTVDLIPTGPGDPLLARYSLSPPTQRACILTTPAARVLGYQSGDRLQLSVLRTRNELDERATVMLKVAGVLPLAGHNAKAIYLPLNLLEAVEAYRDGLAVPELDWDGRVVPAEPVFDGALVLTHKPIPPDQQLAWAKPHNLDQVREVSQADAPNRLGFRLADDVSAYLFLDPGGVVSEDRIDRFAEGADQHQAAVAPYVHPIKVTLRTGDPPEDRQLMIAAYAWSPEEAKRFLREKQDGIAHVCLAPRPFDRVSPVDPNTLQQLTLKRQNGAAPLNMPILIAHLNRNGRTALAPARLAGLLRLHRHRPIRFDQASRTLVPTRQAYASFRLYAATIDDIPDLQAYFDQKGVAVRTRASEVAQIRTFDAQLGLILSLVAVVGLGGAAAALFANLMAAVQRKRRDLAMLGLLGCTRAQVRRFPIYQSVLLTVTSFAASLIIALGFGLVLDAIFQAHLARGESFNRLPAMHLIGGLAGLLTLSIAAAAGAAWGTTRIEIGDAVRSE